MQPRLLGVAALAAATFALGATTGTAIGQQATVEIPSAADRASQKREFKHLQAKQKKLIKRQRSTAKAHIKQAPLPTCGYANQPCKR